MMKVKESHIIVMIIVVCFIALCISMTLDEDVQVQKNANDRQQAIQDLREGK